VKLRALAVVALLAVAACRVRKPEPEAPPPTLVGGGDRTAYAVGLVAARGLDVFEMNERELQIVLRGFDDATAGNDPIVDLDTFGPRIDRLADARRAAEGAAARAMARVVDRAALEPNAVRAPAGFVLQTLTSGSGPSPTPADSVRVRAFGMLPEGLIFDGAPLDKDPKLVSLSSGTACWREALPTMKVGQKVKLTCPSALAYGDQGRPPHVPGGAVVVFEIELVEVVKGGAIAAAAPARERGR
jgi:FKBP-type peptidyl-prolyl cis-trans isomerase FkpA